jgi:RNA polymerase sigma-70 factor, ECF subfamily
MVSPTEISPPALDVYAEARELALIRRIAARDRTAMSELYFGYHQRLANFFSRLTSRPGLVEQMTVDTLVAVWQRADCFQPGLRVSTWIVGMAYRRALQSVGEEDSGFDEGRRRHSRDKMGRALMVLPVAHRAVLALIYCLGCSCDEVASILECPAGKVRTQLLLARQTLRVALSWYERVDSAITEGTHLNPEASAAMDDAPKSS